MDISIVLPIYNEESTLGESVASVLQNSDVKIELIIVNDGSTDKSLRIINNIMDSDHRIRLIDQENSGITQALINGCKQATGKYIARHDAGDISSANRLTKQFRAMEKNPDATLCSVGTRYISERGETMYEVLQSSAEADGGLRPNTYSEMAGPSHHGATMFRRDAYLKVGGYRKEFVVAQDLDLWLRLAEIGDHMSIDEVYYQAQLRPNAISTQKRHQQEIARRAIYDCYKARTSTESSNGSENRILERLENELKKLPNENSNPSFEYNYFVGSMLFKRNPKNSRHYFKQILKTQPWHFKSWSKLALSYFK